MEKKTLTQFKKDIASGKKIVMIRCYGQTQGKLIGIVRQAQKIQTNGVWFGENPTSKWSYMDYPKASNLEYIGNNIKIYDIENGQKVLALEYQFIN